MSQPTVSVVLVTKNGAATLPAVLEAIWRQRVTNSIEIVAVDSGSTDGTQALLRARAHHVVSIRPEEFNPGLTRNLAVARSTGDFIVLLVQDAVPAGDTWLADLIAPLSADPSVAGSFARQAPRADASPIARHEGSRRITASDAARTIRLSPADYDGMTPAERLDACAFDHVCSCIRRSVWDAHRFSTCTIAEDLEWSRDVLLAGHAIAYAPASAVVHSHDRSVWDEFRRSGALHARLGELFDLQTIPTRTRLLRAIVASAFLHMRLEFRSPLRWPRALGLAVAWPLGRYLGGRTASVGQRRAGLGISA